MRVTAAGEIKVLRNGTLLGVTSGLGLLANTYYHIGFMTTVHDTAGTYEVRVNGVTKLTGGPADTKFTASAWIDQVQFLGLIAGNTDYDDLVISTDGFCGDCRVVALLPDAAGNYSEWTPSAGAGWQCVDEPSMNSDTDYVSSSTAGQRNSYSFGAVPSGAVKAVQHVTALRKDDAGSRTTKHFVRIAGTDYDGSAVAVTDTWVRNRLPRHMPPMNVPSRTPREMAEDPMTSWSS